MLEPLYENDKMWQISWYKNDDTSYTIKTENGKINGKLAQHIVHVKEGKNIGKKNETSVEQQTILQATSEWNKKIKQGYHIQGNDSNIGVLKPMLALEYKGLIKYPVWVQPKLDGVRCLIYMNNGSIVFQSRQNTIYEPFEHIVPDVTNILKRMPPNSILDGELYTHGLGFEQIVSMVRRAKTRHPDLYKLKYTLYDFFIKGNNNFLYEERLNILEKAYNNEKSVDLIETKNIKNDIPIEVYLYLGSEIKINTLSNLNNLQKKIPKK